MLELRCADLGTACRATVKAGTKEELLQKVTAHTNKRHGVPQLNQTLVAYALTKVRGQAEERA
jgi:predicted small metal-binding protein